MPKEEVIKDSVQNIMQMNEKFERTGKPYKVRKGKLHGIGARGK